MSIIQERASNSYYHCYTQYTVSESDGVPHHKAGDFRISGGVLSAYLGTEEHVLIPKNVSAIGKEAFKGAKIRSVTIPQNVTEIRERAFYGCTALASIVFLSDVGCRTIGAEAFSAPPCDTLLCRYIHLPKSLVSIGRHAFFIENTSNGYKFPHKAIIAYHPTGIIAKYCLKECLHLSARDVPRPIFSREELLRAVKEEKLRIWDEKKRRSYSIADIRSWIKSLEGFYEKESGELRALEAQKYAKEAELRGLTGIFKASERRRCQKELAELEDGIDYRLRRHNPEDIKANIEYQRKTIDDFLRQPEEELIKAAESYLYYEFTVSMENLAKEALREAKMEEERAEAASSTPSCGTSGGYGYGSSGGYGYGDYTASTSTLPEHGPLATATNCGMPPINVTELLGYTPPTMGDLGVRETTMGDLGLSDPPISDM